MTHWTEHIKDFASKKGLSYKDAMKHPDCSASYKKGGAIGAYLGKDGDVKVVAKQGKGRGRPKKQTAKDREDEKLAMEIHNLKDGEGLRGTTPQVLLENATPPVAKMSIRRGRGRRPVAEAVQDIAGNWVIPPIETFNEMLSMKPNHPTLQSAKRIAQKHSEIATNINNIEKDLFHTPATPAPKKKGRGRPKGSKNQIIQLADAPFISAETDNLGLGANAGKHYISL
jgi:hypothetical protein